jgi:formate hydrogenlyase subunit 3/multisubunit Na+/H+ antiporter MnhD subunit
VVDSADWKEEIMGIGAGIALFVAGAIVTWAINVDLPYVADYALGVILMVAGAVWFVVSLVMFQQRRRHEVTEHHYREGP